MEETQCYRLHCLKFGGCSAGHIRMRPEMGGLQIPGIELMQHMDVTEKCSPDHMRDVPSHTPTVNYGRTSGESKRSRKVKLVVKAALKFLTCGFPPMWEQQSEAVQ